ncbi:hypothetical protein J2S02_001403 [Metabacillus niabensis]|uniref:Uncharacterized protein n=1 Tax=Metabacillus niabensis TaxID=324854 RepID=A0ABT9YYL2_9BACI|nr:hypothetical protein [Metabacillus niabensis]
MGQGVKTHEKACLTYMYHIYLLSLFYIHLFYDFLEYYSFNYHLIFDFLMLRR